MAIEMDKRATLRKIKLASEDVIRCFPFSKLTSGALPQSVAADIFIQYRYVSGSFPKLLCAVAGRLSSDEGRLGIISNLWDEHGRGTTGDGHRAMLDRFISRFGPKLSHASAQTWQTRLYLNGIAGIAELGSLSEAIGMLLFVEAVTPLENRAVLAWLRKSTDMSEGDCRFWLEHVAHDGEHMRMLLDNTVKHEVLVASELDDGIEESRYLETMYWRQFE